MYTVLHVGPVTLYGCTVITGVFEKLPKLSQPFVGDIWGENNTVWLYVFLFTYISMVLIMWSSTCCKTTMYDLPFLSYY